MSAGYVLAWIYAVLLGAGIWVAVAGRPRQADAAAAVGYGIVFGLVACGWLVAAAPAARGVDLFAAAWPWFAAALVVVLGTAAWRVRRAAPVMTTLLAEPAARLPWWTGALLVLLAWRFALIADEAWLRPVFAWDTWIAWAAKAKVWFYAGQSAHFVAPGAWFEDAAARTSLAWHYPELLSRIDLWLAAASGAWNEVAIGFAWPMLWLALLLGCYGQWRALGVDRVPALVAVYALGSLPLINVHAALAGYADLWIATMLVFAVLAWQRWLVRGERAQLALSLVLAASLPLIKFEGIVWSVALLALIAFGAVPKRWRIGGALAALALAVIVVLLSWWLQLAWVAAAQRLLSGETGGRTAASLFNVLRAFGSGLVVQYNWHVLWLVLPVLAVFRWRSLRDDRALGLLALFVAGALVFVVGLFALTPAAKWAESNTAINRLVLQIVPVAVSLCVLWLRDLKFDRAKTDTPRATPAPDGPA